jgi:hypothetical protein
MFMAQTDDRRLDDCRRGPRVSVRKSDITDNGPVTRCDRHVLASGEDSIEFAIVVSTHERHRTVKRVTQRGQFRALVIGRGPDSMTQITDDDQPVGVSPVKRSHQSLPSPVGGRPEFDPVTPESRFETGVEVSYCEKPLSLGIDGGSRDTGERFDAHCPSFTTEKQKPTDYGSVTSMLFSETCRYGASG